MYWCNYSIYKAWEIICILYECTYFQTAITEEWDGTLPLCVRHAYNWYLLKAYDLESMLDTFLDIWKCVETFLEPFEWKTNFVCRYHSFFGFEDLLEFSHICTKSFFHSNGSEIFFTHFQTPMKVSNMLSRS